MSLRMARRGLSRPIVVVATTISDTFDRADSSTGLGTASDGGTWTEPAVWGIASNKAKQVAVTADRIAYRTSTADGFVQATIAGTNGWYAGLVFRYADASNYWRIRCSAGAGFSKLEKKVAGTITQIGASFSMADGDVMRAEYTGSSIVVKRNGTTVLSATDAALATNTKVGLYGDGANTAQATWDNFSATSP